MAEAVVDQLEFPQVDVEHGVAVDPDEILVERACELRPLRRCSALPMAAEDQQHFADALMEPPPVCDALKAAAARHAEIVEPS